MSGIAVVGAGGYLGSRLVAHLRGTGAPTVAITRRPPPWLAPPVAAVDLTDDPDAALEAALEGCHALVHVAGHDEVRFAAEPHTSLHETITMTQRVADAAARVGIARVVYLSTVHVYGVALRPGALVGEATVPEPRAPYAIARLTSEHLLAAALGGTTDLVVLRLTNSVGAPLHPAVDRWSLLANDLARQAVRSDELRLRTAGLQWRDFVDLGDVVRAIATATEPHPVPAGTYNLGAGRPTTVRALADLVAARSQVVLGQARVVVAPPAESPGDAPYTVDVRRLADHGVRLDTPLEQSVDEVLHLCHAHAYELGSSG